MKKVVYCLLTLLIVTIGCKKEAAEVAYLSISPTEDIFFSPGDTKFSNTGVEFR